MSEEIAINEAKDALNKIVSEAEDFVRESVLGGGIFGFGGWNDACGKKIGEAIVSSVENAVKVNLDIYDCQSKLNGIADSLQDIISVIEAAKGELQ